VPAAWQCPDHHTLGGIEFIDHRQRYVAQTPGNSVSLNCRADCLVNDQPNVRTTRHRFITPQMYNNVRLYSPSAAFDRRREFRRPGHAVLRREQCSTKSEGSGGQFAAALAPATRHDRATGTGPHPQAEAMHPCTTPIVRLKCPLALGHGFLSSLHVVLAAPVPLASGQTR
jgi:hypothetical protein